MPMHYCVATGCTNHSATKGIQFHSFPIKRPEMLRKWLDAMKQGNWQPKKKSRLCNEHFLKSDYRCLPSSYCALKQLKSDAVPSVFSFYSKLQKKSDGKESTEVKNDEKIEEKIEMETEQNEKKEANDSGCQHRSPKDHCKDDFLKIQKVIKMEIDSNDVDDDTTYDLRRDNRVEREIKMEADFPKIIMNSEIEECQPCNITFVNSDEIQEQRNKEEFNSSVGVSDPLAFNVGEPMTFRCSLCPFITTIKDSWWDHRRVKHKKLANVIIKRNRKTFSSKSDEINRQQDVGKRKDRKKKVYMLNGELDRRRKVRDSANQIAEKLLYTWLERERMQEKHVSEKMIYNKAKYFFRRITKNDDFSPNPNWLKNFLNRFKIKLYFPVPPPRMNYSNTLISDSAEAVIEQKFGKRLEGIIRNAGFNPQQIYFADGSELNWWVFPEKRRDANSVEEIQMSRDKITFVTCTNFTGSHKLKLLILGKDPRETGGVPVLYWSHPEAYPTRETLLDWFDTEFVPSVRKKMKDLNLIPKALLIFVSICRYDVELISDDRQISAMFLSPNYAAVLRPIGQNIVQAVKLFYRRKFLQMAAASDDSPVDDFGALFRTLDESWRSVTVDMIKSFTSKLWFGDFGESPNEYSPETLRRDIVTVFEETVTLARACDGNLSDKDIEDWAFGTEGINESMLMDINCIKVPKKPKPKNHRKVTHEEAVESFNTCLSWVYENGTPSDVSKLHKMLKKVREAQAIYYQISKSIETSETK